MDMLNQGLLIVGQVTSYEDVSGVTTTATGKSGFLFGVDSLNSCVVMDSVWAPTTETPYINIGATVT